MAGEGFPACRAATSPGGLEHPGVGGSAQQEMIQGTLETLVTRRTKQLQAQLDELRAIVESAGQELAGGILDTRMHVAQLVQHVVTSQQDEQLLKHIQASVRQVQGDCEKLRIVLQGLLDHRCQEEKSIEALSRCVERLEEEKAGKEELLLGIAAKADKTSLAGKVSHSQFEASVEQLKEKMEELTSRVTGQEQGWHQVQQQLREEMDSKQLEEQWNSLQEQLEKKVSRAAAAEAAGIKKQLLARFQGLSCDQPLSMPAPGPEQTGECQRPPVPPSCGDQHTILPPQQRCLQPHPPSTPRPQQPFARLPSKLRVTQHKATEPLSMDRRISRDRRDGQLPVRGVKEGFPRDNPQLSPRQGDNLATSQWWLGHQVPVLELESGGGCGTVVLGRAPPPPRSTSRPHPRSPGHRGSSRPSSPHGTHRHPESRAVLGVPGCSNRSSPHGTHRHPESWAGLGVPGCFNHSSPHGMHRHPESQAGLGVPSSSSPSGPRGMHRHPESQTRLGVPS
ncbi:uncharacterized protein [Patagioenas fasciata]|uniref:uncharacterized protein n=1 Tax=Patagioenas fasciata TaxID=372321 RepID=UPI003A991107